ncbi:MAG: hypothetical protein KBS66_06090 [Eubacterium sp.]|nr:hypothetical protein [Candidatus Colimonas fimequi]
MEALMGMDPDKMVIVLPSGLVAMYAIITIQKSLSQKDNKYLGMIIPVACFIAATILAVRPMLITTPGEIAGLGSYCLRMWLTFNIPTIIFTFSYIYTRRREKAWKEEVARWEAEQAAEGNADSPSETDVTTE